MNITVERILGYTKANKISDQEICRLLNAKKDKVYTWKTDRSSPTTEEVTALAKHFGISTDYLLGNTDDPTPADKKNAPSEPVDAKEAIKMGLVKSGIIPSDRDLTEDEKDAILAFADTFLNRSK